VRLYANDGYVRLATGGTFTLQGDTSTTASTELYYVHNDHLGTPKALTDEAGNRAWSAVHDPFGMAVVDPGSTVEMNVRFPGQYFDAETGLHYNYYRDYDPSTGRYLTSDLIGLEGGLNTYAYVDGNPLNYGDPLGLTKWGGKTETRLVNCPANEKAECNAMCANRGGVKSCKVTRSTRPRIENGYPTREPYTLPNSMNCVCNDPDLGPHGCPTEGSPTGEQLGKAAVGAGAAYLIYRGIRMIPSLAAPPLWPTIPINAATP
jgi:RHS repeat-associated protein